MSFKTHNLSLTTYDSTHAPDPGNAGVGRGNKLSVLPFYPGEQMV